MSGIYRLPKPRPSTGGNTHNNNTTQKGMRIMSQYIIELEYKMRIQNKRIEKLENVIKNLQNSLNPKNDSYY